MAYNDLDNNEMASLFSPFVNNPEAKKQFLSIKEVAGLHEQVTEAYHGILAVKPPDESTDPQLQQITLAQKPVDYRHDRLARFGALTFEAQRELALGAETPDEERAEACDAAYTAMFPEGTAIINASYRAEFGNTERVKELLDGAGGAEIKALLATIPARRNEAAPKKGAAKKGEAAQEKVDTLLDVVEEWIAVGAELGRLEAKKAARLAELASQPAPAPRVVQLARSNWITIATLVTNALTVSKAPLALRNAVGHPLANAATKAGKRSAGKASPIDVPPVEPQAPPEAAVGVPEASGKAAAGGKAAGKASGG